MKNKTSKNGGLFEKPSGIVHFAQSLEGELHLHMPALHDCETPAKPASKGGKKANVSQLKSLFGAGSKKGA
jgi:hypothetical protein